MNFKADNTLRQLLQKREANSALRGLTQAKLPVDFCSNDYLGFARSNRLIATIENEWKNLPNHSTGSAGSRLLAGNTAYTEEIEHFVANFHQAPAGLIYNSGYDANVGLFSALGNTTATFIYDELIHASVHDGIKLSHATAYAFRHNNLTHLEERLKLAKGTIYIAVESIYSMDGDEAPLTEIVSLCEKYTAHLIVDEAHATGVTTNQGKGLIQHYGLENKIFARVHTFGKALGCHGAIVLGSELLRNYLINFSRSFIYTTALPLHSFVAIHQAYLLLQKEENSISCLQNNIHYFKNKLQTNSTIQLLESTSPIQSVIIKGNLQVKACAASLHALQIDVRPILNPTVPKGKERLRICIHSFNSENEIDRLIQGIFQFHQQTS